MSLDFVYHAERARNELDRFSEALDEECAARHLELARLHLTKSQSVRLLEQLQRKSASSGTQIWRTDKEA